jgi:hypothetical protein
VHIAIKSDNEDELVRMFSAVRATQELQHVSGSRDRDLYTEAVQNFKYGVVSWLGTWH